MKKSTELKRKLEAAKKQLTPFHLKHYPGLTSSQAFNAMRREPGYEEASARVRELENQLKYWETREVQKYCNLHMFSDAHPYEVVKVISEICIEVRPMGHDLVKAPKDFHPGGFVGHYADNHAQEHKYWSIEGQPTVRLRWSEAKRQWQGLGAQRFVMSDNPVYFYDYNF